MGKQILPLTFLLVVVAFASYLLLKQSQPVSVEQGLLFSDLSAKANLIDRVRISNHQGVLLDASLEQSIWLVDSVQKQGNYPLEQDKLTQLVQSLMQAKLFQAKTSKMENYARLGLQDIEALDSQSTLIELIAGTESWQVLIGNKSSTVSGSYVRLPQQKQSWLLDTEIVLPLDSNDWLKQPILDIDQQNITKIARVDSNAWVIEKKPAQEEFSLSPMPDSGSLKYATILDSVANNIATLNFDQLHINDQTFWESLQPTAKLEVTTNDGQIITVELAQLDDSFYARFNSAADSSYWHNWIYQLSSFSAGQLNKTRDDFLADAEVPSIAPEQQNVDEGESPE